MKMFSAAASGSSQAHPSRTDVGGDGLNQACLPGFPQLRGLAGRSLHSVLSLHGQLRLAPACSMEAWSLRLFAALC